MAHDFAANEMRPVAWDYDRDSTWPEDILRKAWELGILNTHIAEEYGGPGIDFLGGALIAEELKHKYLSSLTEEFKLASFCLTEPDAGSDVSGMRTTAVRQGDKYVINGSKVFITNGGYADWFTVYAKTDKDAGHRGISAFVVPKDATVI